LDFFLWVDFSTESYLVLIFGFFSVVYPAFWKKFYQ
jgi:hypothetical protein